MIRASSPIHKSQMMPPEAWSYRQWPPGFSSPEKHLPELQALQTARGFQPLFSQFARM